MTEPKRTAKDTWKLKFLVAYRGEQTMHVIHWSGNAVKRCASEACNML
jgi:hypothetical protein